MRQSTAEAHRELDAKLGALDLAGLAGYRRFLEINAAVLLPLEAALEQAGVATILADWPWRSRRAAIAADLARVGGVLRPLGEVPALSRNKVFGTLYVLEGSRLGARYLRRRIAASTDAVIARATAFLDHGRGQNLWQSFLHALEHQPFSADDSAEIVAGAHSAFATFACAVDRA